VRSAQITLHELVAVFRRRKRYFLLPTAVITVLCSIGVFLMSNKYESSTTILVQRDEILNPLLSYQMAVAMASEDRLRTFNEIIYSQTTLRRLADTLGLTDASTTEEKAQGIIAGLEKAIEVERRGSESFRITVTDTDPARAKHATEALADMFIGTILGVESQRNDQTVRFFEKKLAEIRKKFESSQQQVVSRLRSRIETLPEESRQLYTQVETVERTLTDLETKEKLYNDELQVLKTFPAAMKTETGKQALYDLQRADVPFAAEFRTLMTKYDEYSRKYKPMYPDLIALEGQISDLLQRMQSAMEGELAKQQPKREDLEKRRALLVDRLKQSSVSQRVDEDKESDYGIYRKLYDEMKVKLEQAITSRDLGTGGANQFIIIDPALLPIKPTKPNRPQLIVAGMLLGIFFGMAAVILKELLDTTVRSPRDVEVFQKPVIAFIADGRRQLPE
jgi:uncharacterized protein involved in exopolysaccharide biosynthesis